MLAAAINAATTSTGERLDFASEPYVRLYVRDSDTWAALGFCGQTVLMHLLRRANLAGCIYLGTCEPWQAAALFCGVPEEIAKAGAAKLLELGCALIDGGRLVFPRYQAAQNAAATAALRQQESRARKALAADPEPDMSQNVTGDAPVVWDPVFGARRNVVGTSEPGPSAKGAAWLSKATGLEPYAIGGKWAGPLAELAGKPAAELAVAARALRRQAQLPDALAKLTPRHVIDYWHLYRIGGAPGQRPANGNGHGHAAPPSPPEVESARAESDRWQKAYTQARTPHEREAAQAKWLAADRQLKAAKDKSGWNA